MATDDQGPSDGSLLRRFRGGSPDAADLLYRRYAHRLHALVRSKRSPDLAGRVDDEDIVQSAFRCFFEGVSGGSYDVPAGRELWHLLLVITLNKVRAKAVFHRAARRDVRLTVGGDGVDRCEAGFGSARETYALLKLTVDDALDRLPAHYGAAVRRRMEGYEVAEIARETGRSLRSVERILQECRAELGKVLRGE